MDQWGKKHSNDLDRVGSRIPRDLQSVFDTIPLVCNTGTGNETPLTVTPVEEKMKREEDSREKITEERMWSNRPDRIPLKIPTETKSVEFVILEFKRMSDVTDQYVTHLSETRRRGSICDHKINSKQHVVSPRLTCETGDLH